MSSDVFEEACIYRATFRQRRKQTPLFRLKLEEEDKVSRCRAVAGAPTAASTFPGAF